MSRDYSSQNYGFPAAEYLPKIPRTFVRFSALAGLFITYALLAMSIPLNDSILLGGDEGLEFAKAMLYQRGYPLYDAVWDDQPPLHTYLIAIIQKDLWPSVASARLVSVGFGAILLASFYSTTSKMCGAVSAWAAMGLLILSPGFIGLSVSCMLEIPAVALSLVALLSLTSLPRTRFYWSALLGGVIFGLTSLIKLVPLTLLPIAVLVIFMRAPPGCLKPMFTGSGDATHPLKPTKGAVKSAERHHLQFLLRIKATAATFFVLAAVAGLTSVCTDLLLERGAFLRHFQQTWASHFGTAKSFEYGSAADYPFDWTVLLKHWDATIPAVVGVVVCFRAARKEVMYLLPPLWLAWSLLVFGLHRPWWSYYYVHTAIPLCWCAGVGLAFLWRKADLPGLRQRFRSSGPILANLASLVAPTLLALYLLSTALFAGGRAYMQVRTARNSPQIYNSLVLAEMARYKPFTKWLYTDEPIYSFHSGIPLPPDLAVVMLKRFWSGEMTNARLAREVKEYAPGLILLGTRVSRTPLDELLQSEYRLVYFDNDHRLYAHKSISNKPPL